MTETTEEGAPGLPAGWVRTAIKGFARLVGGGTPATSRSEFWSGSIPWITSADIDEKGRVTPRKTISSLAVQSSATNLVPAGSVVVVTRVGLGKVALAPYQLAFSQDSQALVFEADTLDAKFVALQMKTLVSVFKYISRGTTISGVTTKQLRELMFNVPPLPEQRRIVARIEELLSQVDAGVAGLRDLQKKLKRYRAAVLKAACEGTLVPNEAALTPPAPLSRSAGRGGSFGAGELALGRPSEEIVRRARELRQTTTTAETLLWEFVRDRRLNNLKFRRQHPLGRFIADFYCEAARLIIELDGGIHAEAEQQVRDRAREEILRANRSRNPL